MTGRRVCQFLQTKPPPADFVDQNIEAVRSEAREKRPEDVLDFGEVYNYAGQYMQYFDMQVFPHLFSLLGQCPERAKKKYTMAGWGAAPAGSQLFSDSLFVLADGLCENALHARLR